jgi:ribonuclease P protein component
MPQQQTQPNAFTRSQRLLTAAAFEDLQRSGRKQHSAHFAVRWDRQKAAADSTQKVSAGVSRIGLVVGKKQLRRAVDRNAVKRILREVFRQSELANAGVDLTVRFTTVVTSSNKQTHKPAKQLSSAKASPQVAKNAPLLRPRAKVAKQQLAADFQQLVSEVVKRVFATNTAPNTAPSTAPNAAQRPTQNRALQPVQQTESPSQ